MANVAFNATRDKLGTLVEQARDTTADLIAVLLQDTTLQTDGALVDHADLAAILAAGNTEATFSNYVRKTLDTPSRTLDNTGDRVLLSVASPITWTAAGGTTNNALRKILYCYLPSSTALDSSILPLMATDITATTQGTDLQITVSADGFAVVRNG